MKPMIFVVLSVAMGSCTSFAHEKAVDLGCQVSDLTMVFRNPLHYSGSVFCGHAYFYRGQRVYGFYDKPLDNSSLPSVKDPILLPGNVRPPQLETLRTGDRVIIKGVLRPDELCFQPENRCTPFNKPIDIDELILDVG
jgi:hypothetical protein